MSNDNTKHTFNISKAAEELVPDRANRNAYTVSIFIGIILSVLAVILYRKLPDKIPIYLTLPWGENRLGQSWLIGTVGIAIVGIVGLNVTLARLWGGGGNLIPRMLSIASLMFSITMLIAFWGMVQSFFL
ncbi:MAG: hypothetical protein E6P95_00895 [Candidatus Moraniibacteriota bacterium]|nr:MAG: hypothetical protein E6P95_00895 [Candidatus Moranbacteria bacterium]